MDQNAADEQREDATDEILTLLLDDLGPSLQWYRDEVARRLGLTASELPQGREQDVHVRLRPHPARDALIQGLRDEVRRSVRAIVADHGIRGPRHALVAQLVIRFTDAFFARARAMADATIGRRVLADRRRRREADPGWPWWGR